MIGSSKNNRENYPRQCFWTQEKETQVKFNPRLSANRLSNNRALVIRIDYFSQRGSQNQDSTLRWFLRLFICFYFDVS